MDQEQQDNTAMIVRFCEWLDLTGYAVCESRHGSWHAVMYKRYQELASDFLKDDPGIQAYEAVVARKRAGLE